MADRTVDGEVEAPVTLDRDALLALPQTEAVSDIHCVTRWSLFDQSWKGVAPAALLAPARPTESARFALIEGHGGYRANLPLDVLYADGVLFAYEHEGAPLSTEHGGPVRLVVPQRYLWKSVKWVERVTLLAEDQPGTWEQLAYHNDGDPWREERYRGAPPGGRS
ncbi:MAG: molybdopterin-dependent oxidoreductase [Dehalococcoidia bacterium]|nr:molybdopterin-dependent oxidoreductase [Dehalococcoidia bacterium]